MPPKAAWDKLENPKSSAARLILRTNPGQLPVW
jgi:hypothetical protein